ncbi:MAG TPA: Lrp/AsnC ligand binding domain-containing protein [Thermohalobaculum sp.]|nr:Lrp/AsnC ligand binding domain-containing protein [Thermohalobaculum sp.]
MRHVREIDQLDMKILRELSVNGRISVTDLAAKIGLSKTPCLARMRRLETQGYILGYRAVIDPAKVGLGHIAFVEVKLSDTTDKALNAFNTAVRKLAEVEQCHMIAGGFDYLLKVRTGDITAYRHVLGEKISALPHVAQSSTYVAMEAVKDEAGELG